MARQSFSLARLTSAFISLILLCGVADAAPPQRLNRNVKRVADALQAQGTLQPRQNGQDPCYYLVSQYLNNSVVQFTAQQAYDCVVTVPFNATVATSLLQYWRETIEFQSSLAFLKDPPRSYQQPPIDMLNSLDLLQDQIDSGVFTNEFSFESALQRTVYAAHDSHLYLSAGLISLFAWGPPFTIKSVSIDGQQLPKPYVSTDLDQDTSGNWTPSAISSINGESATTFLQRFARLNSLGNLEPHTDYNALMQSPALDILGYYATFDVINDFYNTPTINVSFENGTVLPKMDFQAVAYFFNYDGVDQINNAQDFYNYFVQIPNIDLSSGNNTDSIILYDPSSTSTSSSASATPAPTDTANTISWFNNTSVIHNDEDVDDDDPSYSWSNATSGYVTAYPDNPDVVQPDLGGEGVITGYLLNDSSIGVISLPSFFGSDENLNTFSDTIGLFLNRSKAAGIKKIIVDLQGNLGGDTLLALDAYRRFFPTIDAYAGSRQRAFNYADALGTTYTQYFQNFMDGPNATNQTIQSAFVDLPWAVQNYEDIETGRLFQSWPEYFGPRPDRGDFFTVPQRYNLSNAFFDIVSTSEDSSSDGGGSDSDSNDDDEDDNDTEGIVVYGYANQTASSGPQYSPSDIVMLTDGLCASACTIFTEAMQQVGVKSIVVGGLPQIGPMQAVGGTRGARRYDAFEIDSDIQVATVFNSSVADLLPTDRQNLNFSIDTATINLADQVRQNYFPLQFAYEPADCRIFYSMDNHNNFTQLWLDAANAVWSDQSQCVQDSTGWNQGTTDMYGPTDAQKQGWISGNASQGKANATAAAALPATTPEVPGQTMYSEEGDLGEALGMLTNHTAILDSTFQFGASKSTGNGPKGCFRPGFECTGSAQCAFVSQCGSSGTFTINSTPQCVTPCGSCGRGGICGAKDLTCSSSSCTNDGSCLAHTPTQCSASALASAKTAAMQFARRNSQDGNTANIVVKLLVG